MWISGVLQSNSVFYIYIYTHTHTHTYIYTHTHTHTRAHIWASQAVLVMKNPPANAGDTRDVVSIPGSERSPGEGNGYPLQYSCLENPMDRGAWQATVHRVAKSWTQLK